MAKNFNDPFSPRKNEFDWERLLREDDERVNKYFNELPRYMDLPGEDNLIVEKIRKDGIPVPEPGRYGDYAADFLSDAEGGDFLNPDAERFKREGTDIYLLAGKITRELAIIFSEEKNPFDSRLLARILCILGRIMARSNDIVELVDPEFKSFKIAICKRLGYDINTITGILESLDTSENPEKATATAYAVAELQLMRSRVTNIISRLRN